MKVASCVKLYKGSFKLNFCICIVLSSLPSNYWKLSVNNITCCHRTRPWHLTKRQMQTLPVNMALGCRWKLGNCVLIVCFLCVCSARLNGTWNAPRIGTSGGCRSATTPTPPPASAAAAGTGARTPARTSGGWTEHQSPPSPKNRGATRQSLSLVRFWKL